MRKRILIAIGAIFACMVLILYLVSRVILLGTFAELEERYVRRDVERALSALSDALVTLDIMLSDWAAWDDTYVFIEEASEEYIESNLVDETFIGNRLDLILFINSSGQIVFGRGFDLDSEEEVPIPQGLQGYLTADGLLRHPDAESSIVGIVLLPEAPMLISSRPILTSEEEGPIRGAMIMGRYLDSAEVERLAEVTHLSLTVRRFDDSQMPPDFQAACSFLTAPFPRKESIFVQPLDAESVAGYALLEGIHGEPALVLRVDMPREIYRQGQTSTLYLILLLLVGGLAFTGVSSLMADRAVISRLVRLNADVNSIGTSGNLSKRVSVAGRDELSSLAGAINEMLAALERSQDEVQASEEELRHLVEFESLITTIAIYFINLPSDEIAGGIKDALQAIGEFIGVDRGDVYLLSHDGAQIDNAYEWCASGIEPYIDGWKSLPVRQPSWWMSKLKWFETLHIPRIADLPPEARVEKEPWLPPAVQSVVVTPMVYGGVLTGLLSFSSERAEKTWREAEINLLKTVAGIIATALAREQAEEALRESERRFRDVARTTGDWIWEVDAEGRYAYVSPVVEQVLGYKPEEVLGRHYYDFFHLGERGEIRALIQEAFRRKESFVRLVSPNVHKDGHTVFLETTGLPLTDTEGNLSGYRGAHRDVTAERRLEERLVTVYALGQELVLSRDEQQITAAVVDAAKLLLRCQLCGLWLVDREGNELFRRAVKTAEPVPDVATVPLDSERGVIAAVVRSGEPIYLPDAREDPRYVDVGLGTRSDLCVPLKVEGRVIGVLNAESKNLDAFDEKDRRLLSTLADQAALAIENAQLYEQMRAARDRLQALSRQLVEVQEAERRQIARELHDEIGQVLTGLKLVLEMSGRSPVDEVRVNLDEALTLVNELVGRVRGLSLSLRPTTLDDLGLLPALRWHFERYTTQTNVRVAFKHTGLEGRRFAPEVETAAYRIVQEALTNVARHAEVGEVTVRLWADRDMLGVQVEDQGAGFDVESALVRGTSSGLSGMHERVTLLGGQLTIESAPGVGTRLTAEFSLAVSPAGPLGEPTETGKRYEHNDDRTGG